MSLLEKKSVIWFMLLNCFQAGINVIRENWNLPYSAAFVTCDLFNRSSRQYMKPPKSVSILSKTK
jgi:hypothetical protein